MKPSFKILIQPLLFNDPQSKADRFIQNRLLRMDLLDIRRASKITQKELSALSGLSTQCISDIESIKSGNPTLNSIMKYLDVLGYEICFKRKDM